MTENPDQEKVESVSKTISDQIKEIDSVSGPVKEVLEAVAQMIRESKLWSFRSSLVVIGFLVIIYAGLFTLTIFEKLDGNTFSVSVGILIGVALNLVRSIFPSGD